VINTAAQQIRPGRLPNFASPWIRAHKSLVAGRRLYQSLLCRRKSIQICLTSPVAATPVIIEIDFWFRLDMTLVELLRIVFGNQHAGSVEFAVFFGFLGSFDERGNKVR
jgi:hypothetical protein